jgi:hypothetical protein
MGACFSNTTFDGNITTKELRLQYDAYINDLLHEHGADAYNGTLTTTSGLIIEDRFFDTEKAAYDHVINNTQKWQEARAVKFRDVRTEDDKQPTYNGKPLRFGVGLLAGKVTLRSVTTVFENGNTRVIAADQLTEAHKAKAIALYTEYSNKSQSYVGLRRQIDLFVTEKLQDVKAELPTAADYTELKRLLKLRKRGYDALEKACTKMQEFDIKQAAKIYSTKQVDYGIKWFVGGWAAE